MSDDQIILTQAEVDDMEAEMAHLRARITELEAPAQSSTAASPQTRRTITEAEEDLLNELLRCLSAAEKYHQDKHPSWTPDLTNDLKAIRAERSGKKGEGK